MYGFLIDNVLRYLRAKYHPKVVDAIIKESKLPFEEVDILTAYPESYIPKLSKKASLFLQIREQELFEGVGKYFVDLTEQLGYRQTLQAIGRNFRDLIMNLDNSHDYFKLKFPRMHAPSFFVDQEHENGCTLHYRSKRRGFTYYVLGQMAEIARVIFGMDLKIAVHKQEVVFDTVVVSYKLEFDNSPFVAVQKAASLRQEASMPLRASILFDMFPFAILFEPENLVIKVVGKTLRMILPGIIGLQMNQCFELVRPLVEFSAEQFMQRSNNVFVFRSTVPTAQTERSGELELTAEEDSEEANFEDDARDYEKLEIKGTLMFMPMWKKILFIGCPVMDGIQNLAHNGLFMNDLSLHDFSNDVMLTSSQHMMEEKMTKALLLQNDQILEEAAEKYKLLEKEEDERLCQLIPRKLLKRLIEDEFPLTLKLEKAAILKAEISNVDELLESLGPENASEFMDVVDNVKRVVEHLVESTGNFNIQVCEGFLALADYSGPATVEEQLEAVATLALEIQVGIDTAFGDLLGKGPGVKVKVAVAQGQLIATIIGEKVPKFAVFGPALDEVESLLDVCPSDSILVNEKLRDALPAKFRTVEARLEDVVVDAGGFLFFLQEMSNHTPVPVIPILQAYTSFKANKAKKARLMKEEEEAAAKAEEEDKTSEEEEEKKSFVGCGCKSKLCNIL